MAIVHTATEKEHYRSRADQWFEALDSQVVGTAPDRWTTMVFGVHESPSGTWMQLAAADDPVQSVILRLSSEVTAVQALGALSAWSALPREERPPVIEVNVGTGIAPSGNFGSHQIARKKLLFHTVRIPTPRCSSKRVTSPRTRSPRPACLARWHAGHRFGSA